jgi:hypothetical protein
MAALDLFLFDFQADCFSAGRTTPVPSLKEGGEPHLSAALRVKISRAIQCPCPCSQWAGFPSFLQGGDRGGYFCELVYTQKQTSLFLDGCIVFPVSIPPAGNHLTIKQCSN